MALDLSGSCNLACRYCAEAATLPKRRPMSPEILAAAWRFLLSQGVPANGCSIRLGSGEPLLGFPLMRKISQLTPTMKSGEKDGTPAVFLTTNGTLIDDAIGKWLISSDWYIKISLDGPRSIHDKWRILPHGGGTYDQVASSISRLAKEIPDRLSVTAVLCRGTDPDLVFTAIENLGVRRVELVPVAHTENSILPGPADIERYKNFIQGYAERLLKNVKGRPPSTLVHFERCLFRIMGYNLGRIPCNAGRSFIGVGPAGDFYPCFRFVGLENYRIGHISTGLDRDAIQAFMNGPGRPYELREPCCECWAAPLCGGPCFASTELFGPGDGRPLATHCAYTLANAEAAFFLVDQLKARDPERLLSFLPISGAAFDGD